MAILQPVVALAAWTMAMWLWMYATRIPAMRAAQVDPDRLARDPEASLDRILPVNVSWKAHNFNHLHEAPTLFYAVAITLALLDAANGATLWLAWAYVAFRIAHSLVQALVNKVVLRFVLFNLSQLALVVLIVLAAIAAF